MQYLLLIYGNETASQNASQADTDKMMAAYGAYSEAMQKAGVMIGGNRLRPSTTASTVRVADGKSKVLDRPMLTPKNSSAAII
jgi:hypothetical protein